MSHMPRVIVLDSWSIIAYLEDELAGERVAGVIADAHESGIPLLMAIVNVGEVWYILARETSEPEADQKINQLQELGIEFIQPDWKLTREAAYFKSKNKMSYVDCFAAALAKQRKAHLITGDQEFKQVEHEVLINWMGA